MIFLNIIESNTIDFQEEKEVLIPLFEEYNSRI